METTKGFAPQTPQAIFIANQAIQSAVVESPLIASPSEASPPLTPMLTINPTDLSLTKGERSPKYEGSGGGICTDDLLIKKSPENEKTLGWLGRFYAKSTDKASRLSSKSTILPAKQQSTSQPPTTKKKHNPNPKGILKTPKPVDSEALNRLLEKNLVIERSVHIPPHEIRRLTLNRAHQNHTRSSSSTSSSCISGNRRFCRLTFNKLVEVCETHGVEEYDRSNIDFIAKSLNPSIVLAIKKELNELKAEMVVHQDSQLNTQFYPLPQPKIIEPNGGGTCTVTAINPTPQVQHKV